MGLGVVGGMIGFAAAVYSQYLFLKFMKSIDLEEKIDGAETGSSFTTYASFIVFLTVGFSVGILLM